MFMKNKVKKSKTILFALGFPNPFTGPGWIRVGFLANAWSKMGHEIAVLGTFSYNTLPKKGSKKLGKISIFNLIFNIGINHPVFFIFNSIVSFFISSLFLIAYKPDMVVVSFPAGDVGLGTLLACITLNVRYVVDYRDEWEDYASNKSVNKTERFFYKIIKRITTYLYSKSCLLVTVTSTFLSNLKYRGITNALVIPNGADITVFRQLGKSAARKKLNLSENAFVLVYSGVIGGYYKLEIVIKALAHLRHSIGYLKFLVVGDGPELSDLKKLSAYLGLNDNFIYLGIKNNPFDIAQILSASDIGVIPGVYTAGQLSVKFFEYCACGVPVIAVAPDDSIIVKLINEYKVGLSIPSMNEIKLAESIYKIYADTSFRADAGKRARKLVEEKFDRNKSAEEYLELINAFFI